ncbi:ribosomal protein L7Ae-like RNA K-turn-binding protein [Anaerosolibacter carboniphilus]|uniref:Ribosomal protein L7Ae-like RNA K-turn-binding protein n=1 Tax=Anaerosolibacter carboniphilus TaxID=1417629 RepID=A0A841KSZ3_9FIRM|nr:ribosomal L7Ae/L30e/S12e/Gadd45 family protein [Anaerosolibacter carboniphilus]MBB6216521.1 ribosomal protein L7Ae-like RNA K-turn-binding protein [Anaerosolibacter carboniphilus]
MDKKILSFFGLAQRSGNLITGEDTCEIHIKKGHVRLVIVPQDASENTKKKFRDMCEFRKIQYVVFGRREELSSAVGKSNRAVYAIKDTAFASKIYSLIMESIEDLNSLGGE